MRHSRRAIAALLLASPRACAGCVCRADSTCTSETHHTEWCYIDTMETCSDAVQGEGGPWSELACDASCAAFQGAGRLRVEGTAAGGGRRWVADRTAVEATHGPIAGWDTSRVDDVSQLFAGTSPSPSPFNGAIGGWDTSSVTNMRETFHYAGAFNSELNWDTSKVRNMMKTFKDAKSFDQQLAWDTSSVTEHGGDVPRRRCLQPAARLGHEPGDEHEDDVLQRRCLQLGARLGYEQGDDAEADVPQRRCLQLGDRLGYEQGDEREPDVPRRRRLQPARRRALGCRRGG